MQKFTSSIDYIITDDTSDKHRTKIFKTYLTTDHLATILFSNFRMRLKKLPTTKFFFDKKHYSKEDFSATLRSLYWTYLFCLDNAYHKLEYFNSIMTLALKTNAPMKRVFIRNDKKLKSFKAIDW